MSDRKITWLFLLILIPLVVLTYSNHFHNPFHFDDNHTIVSNDYIRDLKNITLFFTDGATISSNPANQSYRPFTALSYAIDYKLGKGLDDTFYFQLSTFLWYLLQIVLMCFIFIKIFKQSSSHPWVMYAAMFGVSWYALHTSNAETINYICARTDSLSTMGVVAGFAIYLFYPGLRKFHLYLIPVIAGILIKQAALVFAPLLLCYIILFEKNLGAKEVFKKENLRYLLPAFWTVIPAFVVCVAMYFLVVKMTPDTFVPGLGSRFHYMITQPLVSLHYFRTFFLPNQLSADTDWLPLQSIFDIRFFGGFAFLIALVITAIYASNYSKTRPIAFGIAWFIIALLPSSSIIAFAEVMNDHRIFFPFIGLAMAASWALFLLVEKYQQEILHNSTYKFYLTAFIVLVLCGNALGTYERNKVWSSDESLWYDVTIKSPLNGRGLMNYGLTQMSKGNYPVAEKYFLKAAEYIPYYSYVYVNLGVLRNAQGNSKEAEQYFQKAISLAGANPETFYFYANFLKNQKRYSEAIPLLQKALALSPAHIYSKNLMMECLAATSAEGAASPVAAAEIFARQNPTAENYLNLSLTYFRARDFEKCIEACKKALELNPKFASAYNNMCSAYNEMQQWEKAREACEKAIQIDPGFQLAKNNLNLTMSQINKK